MKARSLFCSLLCPHNFKEHLVIIDAQKELANEGKFISHLISPNDIFKYL